MRSFQLIKVLVCPEETALVFLEETVLRPSRLRNHRNHQCCETIETIKVAKPSKPSLNLGFGGWGKPVGGNWGNRKPNTWLAGKPAGQIFQKKGIPDPFSRPARRPFFLEHLAGRLASQPAFGFPHPFWDILLVLVVNWIYFLYCG